MLNNLSMNELMKDLMQSADGMGNVFGQDMFVGNNTSKEENEEIYRPVSELESFCYVDSLFAELFKRVESAKDSLNKIVIEHGEDSAMAEIARDTLESAETSMEVRLIELREDEESSGEAGSMLIRLNKAIEEEKEMALGDKLKKKASDFDFSAMKDMLAHNKKLSDDSDFRMFMIYIFMFWKEFKENMNFAPAHLEIDYDPMRDAFSRVK